MKNTISAFLAAFAANISFGNLFSQISLWVGLGLFLLISVSAVLSYVFFRYQVLADAIQVKQGFLFKKHLNIKFSRIQNVNIRHPFYFRPLGLVTVKIDGAGSKGEEVYLAALTLDTANEIRETIKRKKMLSGVGQIDVAEQNDSVAALDLQGKEEVFYTRRLRDLIIHGLTNNRAWVVLGVIFGFLQYSQFSFDDITNLLQESIGSLISNATIAYTIVLFVIAIVLTIFLTAFLSVLGSILTYYGFTLFRSSRSLMVHRGLINKQEINMQKSRVQTIYFRQDWLDLVLGRANVIYEQISHTPQGGDYGDGSKKLLVPSAFKQELTMLAREVFPVPDVATLEFKGISKRYFYKYSLIWSAIYILIALSLGPTGENNYAAYFLIPWAIHVFMLFMIWKRAGIALVNDTVIVRKGIVGVDFVMFPAFKLQTVDHVQSLLMKRRSLSNVIFHTASRTVKIHYLPTQYVRALIDYCLYRVESSEKSWM